MILNSFNLTKLFWFSLTFRLNGPLWIARSAFWLDGPLFDLDGPNLDFVPLLDVLVQFFSVLQLLVKRQEFRILLVGGGEVSRMLSLCYKVSRAEGVLRCFFPVFEHPTVLLFCTSYIMHQEKLLERAFVNNSVYLNFQSLSRGTMYQIFETLNNFYALFQAAGI